MYGESLGGGIYSNYLLNVSDSTFSHNWVDSDGGLEIGSAIYAAETMNITGSVFFENDADYGDGTIFLGDGVFTVTNSTIYSNSVGMYGAAILNYYDGDAFIHNSTIANNYGDAISLGLTHAGVITLTNSIVANNTSNCMFAPIDNGGNLQYGGFVANSCGATIPTLDPLLNPLADNGGPMLTMRLQSTSPAINHATTNCLLTDQRGFTRSAAPCDSRAYEVKGTGVSLSSSANPSFPWHQATFIATVEKGEASMMVWSIHTTSIHP